MFTLAFLIPRFDHCPVHQRWMHPRVFATLTANFTEVKCEIYMYLVLDLMCTFLLADILFWPYAFLSSPLFVSFSHPFRIRALVFFPSFRFFYLHYTLNLFPSFFYNLLACVVEVEEGIFLFADELLRAAVEEKLKMPWGRNFTRKNHCRVYPRSSFNPFVCAPVCVCVCARVRRTQWSGAPARARVWLFRPRKFSTIFALFL